MKRLFAICALAGALVLGATQANAKDNTGRFGVGADSTLGTSELGNSGSSSPGLGFNIPGLSIVFQQSKIFGLQAILAFSTTSQTQDLGGGDVTTTFTVIGVGMRGIIAIALTDDVNLGLPVGITIVNQSASSDADGDDGASAMDIAFEIGIRPEWFITNNLSVHTQVGLVISLLGEEELLFKEGGMNINLFGASSLLGSAGFTFYF